MRYPKEIAIILWNPLLLLLDDYYADDEDQQDYTTIETKSRIIQEPNSELRQADLVIPGRKVSLHIIKELIEKFSFFFLSKFLNSVKVYYFDYDFIRLKIKIFSREA